MDRISLSGDGFVDSAYFSRWRRRWVGKCTCGATLKPIFRDRSGSLPLFFMQIHAQASHNNPDPAWKVTP